VRCCGNAKKFPISGGFVKYPEARKSQTNLKKNEKFFFGQERPPSCGRAAIQFLDFAK
jgi:hypothetical protein